MFSRVEPLLRSVSGVFFWAKTLFPEGGNHVLWGGKCVPGDQDWVRKWLRCGRLRVECREKECWRVAEDGSRAAEGVGGPLTAASVGGHRPLLSSMFIPVVRAFA
jgi:hypothetical protein